MSYASAPKALTPLPATWWTATCPPEVGDMSVMVVSPQHEKSRFVPSKAIPVCDMPLGRLLPELLAQAGPPWLNGSVVGGAVAAVAACADSSIAAIAADRPASRHSRPAIIRSMCTSLFPHRHGALP